jgi:CRISPR-associated protein Csd2
VKQKAVLNSQHKRAYESLNIDPAERKAKDRATEDRRLSQWMCKNFYDIRAFGAVMTTDVNCGQVRGPIQIGIARSVEPAVPIEYSITRCAVTTEKEAEKQKGANQWIGHKSIIPYALYRTHGYINPNLASQTGFDENGEDLDLFWTSLAQMFELDRSASRGEMAPQSLIVFEHASTLGNAPANKLFDRVRIEPKVDPNPTSAASAGNGVAPPARRFSDYSVKIDESNLPAGITIHRKI